MFLHKQRILSAVIFLFFPLVLSLLCVYYIRLYSHVVRECLCGCSKYQNAYVWCLMNVMHSWFCDVSYLYFFKNTFFSEVSVLSDIRPFRNLTFYNVLASSFCNFPSFRVA